MAAVPRLLSQNPAAESTIGVALLLPQIGDIVELSGAAWRKSTRSSSNGCVEVAFLDGQIAVRDSKNRSGSVLLFTPQEWEAFTGGVRDGEFDDPVRPAQPSMD
jgi:hypothetical protein